MFTNARKLLNISLERLYFKAERFIDMISKNILRICMFIYMVHNIQDQYKVLTLTTITSNSKISILGSYVSRN